MRQGYRIIVAKMGIASDAFWELEGEERRVVPGVVWGGIKGHLCDSDGARTTGIPAYNAAMSRVLAALDYATAPEAIHGVYLQGQGAEGPALYRST